jgi:hypothetical protein
MVFIRTPCRNRQWRIEKDLQEGTYTCRMNNALGFSRCPRGIQYIQGLMKWELLEHQFSIVSRLQERGLGHTASKML